MKKFLVISDTHQMSGEKVVETLGESVRSVDGIIHCGDIVGYEVVEALEEYAPVVAVAGNMDTIEVKKRFPKKEIIEVGGIRIGIVHGWGSPHGIMSKILFSFREEKVGAIFFGHTHSSLVDERDGIFLLNPGSLLDRVFTRKNSYAIARVGSSIEVDIVEIALR